MRTPTLGPLLHVDADAFFASVVMRQRPELRTVPMAVVAHHFIASANYAARGRGVRGGATLDQARQSCPGLIVVDLPRADVEEASEALFDLFASVARAVEPGSMEEAFLDIGTVSFPDAATAGHDLRRRAATELGLPISVGVGTTKLIAKLASKAAKPDGLRVIDPAEEALVRQHLPMTHAWGIGPRTIERLRLIGVERLGDLDAITPEELTRVCGAGMSRRLRGYRDGSDDRHVRPVEDRTTLSASGSTSGWNRPDATPTELAEQCVRRLHRRATRTGLIAAGITITCTPPEPAGPIRLRDTLPTPCSDLTVWIDSVQAVLAGAALPELTVLQVTITGLQPKEHAHAPLF